MPAKRWIVVCVSCWECGGDIAAKSFSHKPTDSEIYKLKAMLGGMFCINERVIEEEEDEDE